MTRKPLKQIIAAMAEDAIAAQAEIAKLRFQLARYRPAEFSRSYSTGRPRSLPEITSDTLHVDDTPVPVLAPGRGKTKTGRLWSYVRDERPSAGIRPPAALFFYSPNRKGEHAGEHLKELRGTIHADGYAGFNELFAGNRSVEAAVWAHARRKFFEVARPRTARPLPRRRSSASVSSTLSRKRSSAPLPDQRRRERQRRSKPVAAALAAWATRPGASCRVNTSSPPRSATCERVGLRSTAASTTAGSRSPIIRPSVHCVVSRSDARIISVRRLRCRWLTRCSDVLAERKRQAQRCQSAALPRRCADAHRCSPGAAHRSTASVELAPLALLLELDRSPSAYRLDTAGLRPDPLAFDLSREGVGHTGKKPPAARGGGAAQLSGRSVWPKEWR